ncbi:MAG: type II secretion system GspH family protein [Phycisphaerales bacterium]|nr:type II secretion system GspH family protein [Phycisphaerales bacterium]
MAIDSSTMPLEGAPRSRPRGFTIVELLVVIGIVGMLLALTFPAIRSVRLAGWNAEDRSQIRQLGLAHLAYQQVNSDRFVDVGLPHGGYGDSARSFVEVLEPYIGTAIMQSPLDRSPYWDGAFSASEDSEPVRRRTSYGMNNYLSRNYSPLVALEGPGAAADRFSRVRHPDQVVSFLHMTPEGAYAVSDHPHVENWSFGPEPWRLADEQISIWAAEGTPSMSALSESNYGFVDGSTGTRRFEEVYVDVQQNCFDPDASHSLTGGS